MLSTFENKKINCSLRLYTLGTKELVIRIIFIDKHFEIIYQLIIQKLTFMLHAKNACGKIIFVK